MMKVNYKIKYILFLIVISIVFSTNVSSMKISSSDEELFLFSEEEEHPKEHKRLKRKEEVLPEEKIFDDDDDDLFSAEEERSKDKVKLKRKPPKKKKLPAFSAQKFFGLAEDAKRDQPILSSGLLAPKEESDEEEGEQGQYRAEKPPQTLAPVIKIGTQLKLLANVYHGKIDQTANIFFPQCVLDIKREDGTVVRRVDYFKTPKGQICVFASGGTQNVWEKTVAKVNEIFFGQKVKVVRSSWLQKHLRVDKGVTININDQYKGREHELHSEFYYDLFFRYFFLPSIQNLGQQHGGIVEKLSVRGFSWWEICDSCNGYFTGHKALCEGRGIELTEYLVAAVRRYRHNYPQSTLISGFRVPKTQEEEAWKAIWSQVQVYATMEFEDEDEKKKFWTRSVNGLELCKWLGQAFVENTHSLLGSKVIPKQGDILRFYNSVTEADAKPLKNLLLYLREKNWDLSCWYKVRYPAPIQKAWKKFAQQAVMPHFKWRLVAEFEDEARDNICEMCGNEDVYNMSWVYHPKFRVSQMIMDLPEEEQGLTDRDYGFSLETPYDGLPDHIKKKRKQSLIVGSQCVQFLQIERVEVDEWREDHPDEELEKKLKSLNARQEQNELIDDFDALELLAWMRDNIEGNETLTKRYILKHSAFGSANDLNPLLKVLIAKKKIREVEKGKYSIIE